MKMTTPLIEGGRVVSPALDAGGATLERAPVVSVK